MTEETKQEEKREPIDYAKLLTELREANEKRNAEFRALMADAMSETCRSMKEAELELEGAKGAEEIAKRSAILAARASSANAMLISASIRICALEVAAMRSAGPLGMFGL